MNKKNKGSFRKITQPSIPPLEKEEENKEL